MTEPKEIKNYIDDVISGKVVTGELERKSVERYLDDKLMMYDKGWYFDVKSATRPLLFFGYLRHGKGRDFAGKKFILESWQQFALWNLFGWKKEEGRRRFNEYYLDVSRKNGKTTFAAGVALYMLSSDGEASAEVYSAATTYPQASISLAEAKNILRYSPNLSSSFGVHSHAISHPNSGSSFKPVSSEHKTLDGLNTSFLLIDEFHAHPDSGLFDVMASSMGARLDPLKMIITTAGFKKTGPCFAYRDVAIKVLRKQLVQDDTFIQIFTLDENDSYEDESVWKKCNPNLGVSLKINSIRADVLKAKNNPTRLTNLLTKTFNVWTNAAKVWIKDEDYLKCVGDVDMSKRCKIYAGLDLSSVRDITALSLLIESDDKKLFNKVLFFMPADNIRSRSEEEGISYELWANQGWIITTPGNVTDYNFIKSSIKEIAENHELKVTGYDRWNSSQLVIDLIDEGLNMQGFGQGFASMSPPTKAFNYRVLKQEITFEDNPVFRWMLSNVVINRDAAGNEKPDKEKSANKIDGVVASIIALGEYMNKEDEMSEDDYQIRVI